MNTIEAFSNPNLLDLYKCSYANSLLDLNMEGVTSIDMVSLIKMSNNDIILTDITHPYCATNSFFLTGLHINHEFYNTNKKRVEEELIDLINKYQASSLTIKSISLITDSVIDAIANNPNIKNITLGDINDENNWYVLSESVYQKLSNGGKEHINTSSVADELAENFDPSITYNRDKPLIGSLTYQQLIQATKIYIKEDVNPSNFRYIKYIPDNIEIEITSTDYPNIKDFLNALSTLDKKFKINISLDDKKMKNALTEMLLANKEKLENLDLTVKIAGADKISFIDYLNYENRLYDLIKNAINLSPFERYLHAYKVTSHFKQYKENSSNAKEARKLYQILDNDYMVCVGYSMLLEDLLDKLDIESYDYSTVTELTFDNVNKDIEVTPDDIKLRMENHARRIVRITDPKYGIDGFYISDPTWDNILAIDSFCFAALTPEETLDGDRYFLFNNYDGTELLNINSLEEFYTKINHIIDHNGTSNKENPELMLIETLLNLLFKLDAKYILALVDRNPNIRINNDKVFFIDYDCSLEYIQDLLIELGEYILSKVNKPISAEIYEQALYQMYLNALGLEEKEAITKTEKALHNTYVMIRDKFPKRMRLNPDGTEEVYSNETNKFAEYNLLKDSMNL